MEHISLMIGEKKIPMKFGMRQFIELEEELGNLAEIKELLLKGKKRLRTLVFMIRVLGNAGLKHEGQEPDLTEEWLEENMDPHHLLAYQIAVLACMTKETESQAIQEENENKERDLVLEEINAKKEPVNSPAGE